VGATVRSLGGNSIRAGLGYFLSFLVVLGSGILGSFGLIGLIDKVFGWNSLHAFNSTLHDAFISLATLWDSMTHGTMIKLANLSGLQAETNTIAASVAMLLLSSVGIKHFQVGFFQALKKREKKKPGRKAGDERKQFVNEIKFWLKEKRNTIIEFFKTDTWITVTMITAYLFIVFAVNLSATPVHPETIKGVAYTVLAYAGYHAIRSLIQDAGYLQYLGIMLGSSVVLVGVSSYIQASGLPS